MPPADPKLRLLVRHGTGEQDIALAGDLLRHLEIAQRFGGVAVWSDAQIHAGDNPEEAIARAIAQADVALLLLSADFLASKVLEEVEVPQLLARHKEGKIRVIPVVMRSCLWEMHPWLKDLHPLPKGGEAIGSLVGDDRDAALKAVTKEIVRLIPAPSPDALAPRIAARSPEPAYESEEIRALAQRLESARDRRKALEDAGASTAAVADEILDLRRRLREGGRLRAGDELENGRYLLIQQIGRGGFASVWEARDRDRNEPVAIKVLHPDQARDASRRERFFRGARVMRELGHEAVVRVVQLSGEDGGYHYFVMDLIDGEDLHRAVTGGRFAKEATVPLLLRVGEALAQAHAKGIVHRDVKPANILLDKAGKVLLTDFDLVAAKDTTGGTRTGAMGTFLFMAPEQIRTAKDADARADVYGLGMTAIFCLHGADLPAITMRRPEKVIAGLSCEDAVKQVLTRAIELEPQDRYADAQAFCDALRGAQAPQKQLSIGNGTIGTGIAPWPDAGGREQSIVSAPLPSKSVAAPSTLEMPTPLTPLFARGHVEQVILLNGEWNSHDLAKLERDYTHVYAFNMLFWIDTQPDRYLFAAMVKSYDSSGVSWYRANALDQLISLLPKEDRPVLKSAKLSSPGMVGYSVDPVRAAHVGASLRLLGKHSEDLSSLHAQLRYYLGTRHREARGVTSSTDLLWAPSETIQSATVALAESLCINPNQLWAIAKADVAAGELLEMYYRRARDLYATMSSGRAVFVDPSPAKKRSPPEE